VARLSTSPLFLDDEHSREMYPILEKAHELQCLFDIGEEYISPIKVEILKKGEELVSLKKAIRRQSAEMRILNM
jgi:hypothetical protein